MYLIIIKLVIAVAITAWIAWNIPIREFNPFSKYESEEMNRKIADRS